MTLIDSFLAEHPFFCALLEHERRILAHYIELYRCPKNSYLVLPNELQEVLWIVVRGRLGEYGKGEDSKGGPSSASDSNLSSSIDNQPEQTAEATPQSENQCKSNHTAHSHHNDSQNGETPEEASESASDQLDPIVAPSVDISTDEEYQGSEHTYELPAEDHLLRYFFPGDLINVNALTQELITQNLIISLEDNTQVICMSAFHLAKLAQQQPKIHRALRPVYNDDGYLVSGLPFPVWQQMSDIPPPHTRDFGKQWLQRKPLIRSHNSWNSSIITFFILGLANIWQFEELHWNAVPFLNVILALISLVVLIFVVSQRYRCEYTLKQSLLHITERGIWGLSSKIKSYPLLSIRKVELISVPIITRLFQLGGLRILTYHNEVVQVFPIDRVQRWLEIFQTSLEEAQQLQKHMQHNETVKRFQKWHKLQPELIKEINYRNAALEGKLHRSLRALLLQTSPMLALGFIGLHYSLQSELFKIYLTIPLFALGAIIVFQLLRWFRYNWIIDEEFLLRYDNFMGHKYNQKILIRNIQDVRLEYLNVFGFSTISITVNDQFIQLQNLKDPQNILDEIESLRHCNQNPAMNLNLNDFLTHSQLEIYHDLSHSYVPK